MISLSLLGGSQIQWESVAFTLLIANNGAALEWLLGGAGRWEGGGVVRKWPKGSNALPSLKHRFRFLVIDIVSQQGKEGIWKIQIIVICIVWQQGKERIWNPWPCVLFFLNWFWFCPFGPAPHNARALQNAVVCIHSSTAQPEKLELF